MRVADFIDGRRIYSRPDRAETPRSSVLMPVYRRNRSGLLLRALRSVAAQTFTDFELCIVDDGSTDGSFETCVKYQLVKCRNEQMNRVHAG